MASPASKKRTFDEHASTPSSTQPVQSIEHPHAMPTPPLTAGSSDESPLYFGDALRRSSPTLSSSALSTADQSTIEVAVASAGPASAAPPPAKRRKITVTEKEELRKAKELRAHERAEKKAEKEEEKNRKEEEKQVKDEARRVRNEEKEAKQREKELDKQRKEEEKCKKDKAQLRLGNFFARPQTPKPDKENLPLTEHPTFDSGRRKSLSLEPYDSYAEHRPAAASSAVKQPQFKMADKIALKMADTSKSDYEKYFLPFVLPSYSTCTDLTVTPEHNDQEFDELLYHASTSDHVPTDSLPHYFPSVAGRSRGLWQPSAREVVESIQGSSQHPLDLTVDGDVVERHSPQDLLAAITIRHLHFAEDVRPPYSGSYTSITTPAQVRKLRRNPLSRTRTDTDYDYDSEAEWEEPEDGEDIMSEGEDEVESVADASEMDGFLDDEEAADAAKGKRRLLTGDLQPLSSGLCWQDSSGRACPNDVGLDLASMTLDWLIDTDATTIDPLSAVYWQTESAAAPKVKTEPAWPPTSQMLQGVMMPPSTTLQVQSTGSERSIVGAASGMTGPIMAVASIKPKAAAKKLALEQLEAFKEAVDGSNVTKADLLKALKKRFPKFTNDTIKETLSLHGARIGPASSKYWKFVIS